MEDKIKVTFVRMDSSDALKRYLLEKINKYHNQNLLENMTAAEATFTPNIFNRGISTDFVLDISVYMPKSVIHVEEVGGDMYSVIDAATDKLFRRLKRYHDKTHQWEGKTPWKVLEAEEAFKQLEDQDFSEDSTENYTSYVPKITERRTLNDLAPIDEAEAIEKMELGGYSQYLFKNSKNGKFCMVYRMKRGGYGLVEPADGVA